jgi:hypothetical protein
MFVFNLFTELFKKFYTLKNKFSLDCLVQKLLHNFFFFSAGYVWLSFSKLTTNKFQTFTYYNKECETEKKAF